MGQSFYPNDCRQSKRRGFEHLQVTKFFQIQTDSSSMLRVIKLLVYLDWEIMNVLMENVAFGEGPHWKNGNLWFSDMHSQQVIKLAPTGSWEIVVALKDDQTPDSAGCPTEIFLSFQCKNVKFCALMEKIFWCMLILARWPIITQRHGDRSFWKMLCGKLWF